MPVNRPRTIALALASPGDEALWRGILESQRLMVTPFDASLGRASALVADIDALTARGLSPREAVRSLQSSHPGLRLLVRLPERAGFTRAERQWAKTAGIESLLPGGTVAAWRESIQPMVERILSAVGVGTLDDAALDRHVRELVKRGTEPRACMAKDIYADAFVLKSQGIDALALHEAMQGPGGVPVEDRSFRGKTYPACFVASQAIDWMARAHGVRRASAETVCRFLARTGRIHHVVREARFADDYLFFRFAGTREQLAGVDLARLERAMTAPGGLAIADRTWRGKTFPRCFVGGEAVEWIMRHERLPFGAAEAAGQSLLELGELRHVSGEHGFLGDNYFYRFTADERAMAPQTADA